MYDMKIGVMLDSFRLGTDAALDAAVRVGACGLQVYATKGSMAPENMTSAARREFADKVSSRGLVISALCGDFGCGFGSEEANPSVIEKSKRVLDLACELGTNIVTTHIGVIPADSAHPRYCVMQQACAELAAYADSLGAHFAVETGPEPAEVLCGFLDSLDSTGVAVNLDPANIVMVTGGDPAAAVHTLSKYIVHTHAKDGIKLYDLDPEIIYGVRSDGVSHEIPFRELPLGEGKVDFDAYLSALASIGYHGYLTVEREVGADPFSDILHAVNFLKNKLA